jgi:hypothetical protein
MRSRGHDEPGRHRRLLAFALALAIAACPTAVRAQPYTLGEGLSLFDGHLRLGGYLAAETAFLDQSPDQLRLDDMSVFVTWNIATHWTFFTEAELEDVVHVDGGGFGSGDDVFRLERLYLQWKGEGAAQVRAGRMLTPFGIWNRIHAAPLVWTTSRPIATEAFFDTGVTGLEVSVSRAFDDIDVTLVGYGQATANLDDSGDANESDRAVGGRLEAGTEHGPTVGASFVHFHDDKSHRNVTAIGADFYWSTRLVEVSAEVAANEPHSRGATWAAYIQVVGHAPWRLHPFLRIEYSDLGGPHRVPVVPGIAFKPGDATILKIEGLIGAQDTPLGAGSSRRGGDGVLASFAVLF